MTSSPDLEPQSCREQEENFNGYSALVQALIRFFREYAEKFNHLMLQEQGADNLEKAHSREERRRLCKEMIIQAIQKDPIVNSLFNFNIQQVIRIPMGEFGMADLQGFPDVEIELSDGYRAITRRISFLRYGTTYDPGKDKNIREFMFITEPAKYQKIEGDNTEDTKGGIRVKEVRTVANAPIVAAERPQ